MIITQKELIAKGHTLVSAQNALQRATLDAINSGYKVVRVSDTVTDNRQRTRRIIREVRIMEAV